MASGGLRRTLATLRAHESGLGVVFTRLLSTEAPQTLLGEVSGIPIEQLKRKVLIYSPARCAMQSGLGALGRWKIRFDSTEKWENPLMGWTSTADPYASVTDAAVEFESKEDAIAFVQKYGWDYTVVDLKKPKKVPKAYADNFRWRGPAEEA